jgi:uncharacterized protein (TIGR00251 family)
MTSTRVNVRLTPRAVRDEVVSFEDGVLRVRVTAPPVDGRANEALMRLLAATLDVPRSTVRLVTGATSRQKLVAIDGLTDAELRHRLGSLVR